MKESRLDDWSNFISYQKQRGNIKLSPVLQAMMDNCQYVLHTQFDKNTKAKNKHKRRKNQLTQQYRQAFKSLDRDQKLAYYLRFMKLITTYIQGIYCKPVKLKGVFSTDVYTRSYNLKMWKHKKLRLDRQKYILYAEKDNKIKTYMLEDYLIRKSKSKQYYTLVLEAVNNKPHEKSRTVHLGFKQQSKYNQWFKELIICFDVIQWNFIVNDMKNCKDIRRMSQNQQQSLNSDVMSQRSKITQMDQDNNSVMSKSVFVGLNNKSQIVSKYQDSFTQSYDPKSPNKNNKKEQITRQKQSEKDQQFFSGQQEDNTNSQKILNNRQTIIQSIAKIDDLDEIQKITKLQQKKVITNQAKQNIFQRIMPEYKLDQVNKTVNYGTLFTDQNMRILGHLQQPLKLKIFTNLPSQFSQHLIMNALTDSNSIKQQNPQIQEISLKTLIKSQNSAMMYLKIKAYNKLYRPRDFIFLRHVFSAHQVLYIVDKSIENISFPPFTTIVRGQLCILWAIIKQSDKNVVIADININNEGYLNDAQNVNLALKYLKGYTNLAKTIKKKQSILENFNLFYEKWNIVNEYELFISQENLNKKKKQQKPKQIKQAKRQQKQLTQQKVGNVDFKKKKGQSTQNLQNGPTKQIKNNLQIRKNSEDNSNRLIQKYSHMEEEKGQMDLKQIQHKQKLKQMTVNGIKTNFDSQGMVIISKSFIKTKYILQPLPKKQLKFQQAIQGHPIWKGEWIHDDKVGSIIFINQKKIEDQKGVLKFILTKIGKNILSGKSVLNISLPVDIFCAESNLQRLVYSLTYAPTHLQPAVKDKNPLERLKKIVAFGISNSPLYLNMEKPFNPILGQTFQCWIDGCPIYAEQISHHPPIAAILYEGRGFRMTAQLQSKVQLHMNSGCGTNDGVFKIKFEDGMEICYITPGGQVSGLTYGDRKFNMVGKAYYWIQSQSLFLELVFNPARKGFFSVGKQEQPIDYLQGYICKVKPEFFSQFNKKRRPPTQKQILQKYGKVHGIWNKTVLYQNHIILDLDKQFPVKLQYQANPLPSDCNWREDIAYRRILEISRSQTQKQRLEVFQRKDRKLRQANPNHQNHHKK